VRIIITEVNVYEADVADLAEARDLLQCGFLQPFAEDVQMEVVDGSCSSIQAVEIEKAERG
jgi:hypothetical protein